MPDVEVVVVDVTVFVEAVVPRGAVAIVKKEESFDEVLSRVAVVVAVLVLMLLLVEAEVVIEPPPLSLLLAVTVAAVVDKVERGVHMSQAAPFQPLKHSHTSGATHSPLKHPCPHTGVHCNGCRVPAADARASAAANSSSVKSCVAVAVALR